MASIAAIEPWVQDLAPLKTHHGEALSMKLVCWLGGLEVACPLRNPKIAVSKPAGINRFSGCENRRHAYDYVACKRSLVYQYASGTLGKIKNSGKYVAFNDSLN
ncbi:hypothetical protein TNCV_1811311 [Trichonephila clavipes]|nr:hypothetical protein TNCV_1811311 [Trichonephila clavipes]